MKLKNDSNELNLCVRCGKVYTDDVRVVCLNCREKKS